MEFTSIKEMKNTLGKHKKLLEQVQDYGFKIQKCVEEKIETILEDIEEFNGHFVSSRFEDEDVLCVKIEISKSNQRYGEIEIEDLKIEYVNCGVSRVEDCIYFWDIVKQLKEKLEEME